MSMLLMSKAYQECEYTQRIKNKAFKGEDAHPNNRALAIELLNKGVANNRVEKKTGLAATTICRIKSDMKAGLI